MTTKQDDEPSKRQLVLACLLVRWLLLSRLIVAIRLVYRTERMTSTENWITTTQEEFIIDDVR